MCFKNFVAIASVELICARVLRSKISKLKLACEGFDDNLSFVEKENLDNDSVFSNDVIYAFFKAVMWPSCYALN